MIGHISNRDDVIDNRDRAFDDDIWVERNMFSLNGVQKYVASWEQFCEAVKHEAKHGPGGEPEEEDHDTISVSAMLEELAEIVQESGHDPDATGRPRHLQGQGAQAQRRVHQSGDPRTTAERQGADQPHERSRRECLLWRIREGNRSRRSQHEHAGGTRMDSDRRGLAMREVATGARPFRAAACAKPLRSVAGMARSASVSARVREIDQRTGCHDGGEHIEYVPTQILTEHFRKEVAALDGSPLDGIVYPSARRRGGKSLVVFRSRDDLDPATLSGQEPLLKLDHGSVTRLRRARRRVP